MTDSKGTCRLADISTPRLDLIAITPDFIHGERAGSRERFESLVDAKIPEQWPPQDWETHVLSFLLEQMTVFPWSIGWARFVALRTVDGHERVLIGTVGAVPPGTAMSHSNPGEIEVGYGILPAFQCQGYATEALSGLMEWIPTQAKVHAFVAQTVPDLQPSIRVLEKSGFLPAGKGFEAGTILFSRACADAGGRRGEDRDLYTPDP